MSNKKSELLEWYDNYQNGIPTATNLEIIRPPSTSDLSNVPSGSPQIDIQQEIIKKQTEEPVTMKNDQVIAQDKMNAYKAYGTVEVIRNLLTRYSDLSGREEGNFADKEAVANELKKLANDLNDIIAKL